MKSACTAHSTPRISRHTITRSAARSTHIHRLAAAATAIVLAAALLPVTIDSARLNLEHCIAAHAIEARVKTTVFTADLRYRAKHLEAIAACSRGR